VRAAMTEAPLARSSPSFGWVSSLFGVRQGCCKGAPATEGDDADGHWSLQAEDDKVPLVAAAAVPEDKAEPSQVHMKGAIVGGKEPGSDSASTAESENLEAAGAKAKVGCPMGHPLTQFQTEEDGKRCLFCGVEQSRGATFHTCRKCKFELCTACQSGVTATALQKEADEQASAAVEAEAVAAKAASKKKLAKLAEGTAVAQKAKEGASASSKQSASGEKKASDAEGDDILAKSKKRTEKKAAEAAEKEGPKKNKNGKKPISYLAKVKEERRLQDLKAIEMGKFVDDMLAGKFDNDKPTGNQPQGNMIIRMPTPMERKNTKLMVMAKYRVEYDKLRKKNSFTWMGAKIEAEMPCTGTTNQYSTADQEGLKIQGGHQHMPRPKNPKLPKDFRKPVGEMTLKKLKDHGMDADRMLVSVYGDIFDVSDRPDKYGPDGPYSWMTGHDITWGFLSGRDVPETIDFFYDIWKIAPEDFREKKLNGVVAWVAWYEYEYGGILGRLTEYNKEVGLKGPPMEQAAEDCCIM